VKHSGMAGFLWMISLFSRHDNGGKIVGIFCLIGCVFWWVLAACMIYLWIHVRVVYKNRGGNQQAQREFAADSASRAAQNPDVFLEAGKAGARA